MKYLLVLMAIFLSLAVSLQAQEPPEPAMPLVWDIDPAAGFEILPAGETVWIPKPVTVIGIVDDDDSPHNHFQWEGDDGVFDVKIGQAGKVFRFQVAASELEGISIYRARAQLRLVDANGVEYNPYGAESPPIASWWIVIVPKPFRIILRFATL